MDEIKSKLEEKIIKAKELGIKFILVQRNLGLSMDTYDTLQCPDAWTDEQFESALDNKIKAFESKSFIKLLSKHKLIT